MTNVNTHETDYLVYISTFTASEKISDSTWIYFLNQQPIVAFGTFS